MNDDRITPVDLVHHMLTEGSAIEWVAFILLLGVVAIWVVGLTVSVIDAVKRK